MNGKLLKHVREMVVLSFLAIVVLAQTASGRYAQTQQGEDGYSSSQNSTRQATGALDGPAIAERLRSLGDALSPTLAGVANDFTFERAEVNTKSAETKALSASTSHNWLLLIGIDKYSRLPQLVNSVRDLKTVANILTTRYDFDRDHTIELYDQQATRANVIRKLEELVRKVGPNDNLLIYYEGHGYYSRTYKHGYWLPVDADEQTTSQYIADYDLQTYLAAMRSRSVLVISDACFSGTVFPGKEKNVPNETDLRYIQEVSKLKARQVLTSGGDEPVMGGWTFLDQHSLFAHYVIDRLGRNTDRYLAASSLFQRVKTPVSSKGFQTPEYKTIQNAGDEGGEFLFVRR
jgi:hypothetical protein